MAQNVIDILIKVTDEASAATKKISGSLDKLADSGKSMMKVGGAMTAGITAPMALAAAATITATNEINAGLANVASLGVADVDKYRDSVQQMSIDVGKSTTDLTSGLYQVVSAFGETSETMQVLQINSQAAAAGLATTEQAIALTSAVTKAWGDTSAAAVQQASDLAFTTVQLGQTSFPELASAMGRVTGMSKTLGVSQEEMFAVMATATGVTGQASEVSTQLAGVYAALLAPTESLAGLYGDLGVASGEALIEQEGLQGAIALIVESAAAAGEPLQKYIGSVEAGNLAIGLAGSLSDDYTTKLAAMGSAAGAADAAFIAQTQGINATAFEMIQLRQQVTVLSQDIGEALIPALGAMLTAVTPLLTKVAEWIAAFGAMSPAMQQGIIGMVALVAAIGPAVTVLGAMATALGVILSPIGLVVAAVVGLVAVLFDIGGAGTYAREALESWGLENLAMSLGQAQEAAANLVETIMSLMSGEISFGDLTMPTWVGDLMIWKWPTLGVPPWIETLFSWAWPILGPVAWAIRLMSWAWPTMSKPGWLDNLLGFNWPSFPGRPAWLGGEGDAVDSNATGTSYFRGGLTMVGETGPELVQLPRGSQIHSAGQTAQMAMGGVTVNVAATVNNEQDAYVLARQVANILQRGY